MDRIIVVKNSDYVSINRLFFADSRLSLKAKGLLGLALTMDGCGDGFSISSVLGMVRDGRTAVYSAIDELKSCGYCRVSVRRDEKTGRIAGTDYEFHEISVVENPHSDLPHSGFPDTGFPDVGNLQKNCDCAINNIITSNTLDITSDNNNNNNTVNSNTNEIEKEKEKKVNTKKETEKELFTKFAQAYKRLTGKRIRGIDTEFSDFKSRHKDWKIVLPYLTTAIERESSERAKAAEMGKFFPEPKMLQTWLGKQRSWEMYVTIGEDIEQAESEYRPTARGFRWMEDKRMYLHTGQFFMGDLLDGYQPSERPDGATVMLNNARGVYRWNSSQQKWIKQ